MTKVACYCRVSTKKEEQESSLENQRNFFETYAEKNNLEIYDVYADDGITATSMKKRDSFNKMIRDAKQGLFNHILVKDISRFARNTLDFLQTIRELKSIGIEVNFITANMTTGDGELTLTVLAAAAQEESSNLSKRVKFGKRISAENGRVPSCVYGYDKIKGDKYGLNINEREADVVKRIFDLYITKQNSCLGIAKMLNNEGVSTKRGGKYRWSQTVISEIIKNKLYIGIVCTKKSEIIDFMSGKRKEFNESEWIETNRPEFRIISDEVFNKANEIRLSRSNSFHQYEDDGKIKRKRPSIKYPLSNLIVCSNDNYSFRRRDRTYKPSGRRYIYWTCSKRDMGVAVCDNMIKIDEAEMHRAILDFLLSMFKNRELIVKKFKECVTNELTHKYNSENNVKNYIAEDKKLTSRKQNLITMCADGIIDKESLKIQLSEIEGRIREINTYIELYNNTEMATVNIEKCLSKLIQSIDINSDSLLDNAFLKTIFEKFIVNSDGKVTAIIKVDNDTGANISIPFCEIVEDCKVAVPKCTSEI